MHRIWWSASGNGLRRQEGGNLPEQLGQVEQRYTSPWPFAMYMVSILRRCGLGNANQAMVPMFRRDSLKGGATRSGANSLEPLG